MEKLLDTSIEFLEFYVLECRNDSCETNIFLFQESLTFYVDFQWNTEHIRDDACYRNNTLIHYPLINYTKKVTNCLLMIKINKLKNYQYDA